MMMMMMTFTRLPSLQKCGNPGKRAIFTRHHNLKEYIQNLVNMRNLKEKG